MAHAPDFNKYQTVYDRLSLIRDEDPAKFQQLAERIIRESNQPMERGGLQTKRALSLLSTIAAKNPTLYQAVIDAGKTYHARIVKQNLKPKTSKTAEALDLAKSADHYVGRLSTTLIDANLHSEKIHEDARQIASVFSPRLCIEKRGTVAHERTATEADLRDVDAIVINGNNDISQVDHAARLFFKINNRNCKVYVSGFGGHATSPGYIFSKTEAEVMRHRLIDLGVPANNIVLETEATNSGENVRFVVELMKKEATPPRKLLICGTPAAVLRQLRSFEKQASYPWDSLLAYAPTDLSTYYATDREATINIMCALREIASFVDYTINTEFMSARAVQDEQALNLALRKLFDYYNLLNKKELINPEQQAAFIKNFLDFSRRKAQGETGPEIEQLKKELDKTQKPIADFYRRNFNLIEIAWVRTLSHNLSHKEHKKLINEFADYRLHALDLD